VFVLNLLVGSFVRLYIWRRQAPHEKKKHYSDSQQEERKEVTELLVILVVDNNKHHGACGFRGMQEGLKERHGMRHESGRGS